MTTWATRVDDIGRNSLRHPNVFGPEVISLASGDPFELAADDVLSHVREAVVRANLGYTHPYGLPALRDQLAEWVGTSVGRRIEPAEIVVTNGASSGLAAIALAIVNPGDRVLLPSPTYSLYADVVRLAGGVPQYIASRPPTFDLPLDEIAASAASATMIIICNPCNPTGTVYSREQLTELAEIAAEHHIIIVSDEAYSSIVYPPTGYTSALSLSNESFPTILVDTFSKRLCMTGLRLGYVVAPPETAKAIARIHHTLLGWVATPAQVAVAELLTGYETYTGQLLKQLIGRRRAVDEALSGIRGISYRQPAGGFYAFFSVPAARNSVSLVRRLVAGGVGVRPGAEFGDGGEGYLRIAFCGNGARLAEGLQRLKDCLEDGLH